MERLKSDSRYSIAQEFAGYERPRFVVRFCGEFVSSHATRGGALIRAAGESAARRGALVITESKS